MRVVKEGKIRKNEILDISLSLFGEKGYDSTTVEDILGKVGISKGTFYYYFKAKSDVLEALAWREAEKKLLLTKTVSEETGYSALEKLHKIIREAQKMNFSGLENKIKLLKSMDETDNIKLQQKLYENAVFLGVPMIRKIIEQGIRENSMKTDFPGEAAEMYIEIMNHFKAGVGKIIKNNDSHEKLKPLLENNIRFYEDLLEKLLGIEKNNLLFLDISMEYIGTI